MKQSEIKGTINFAINRLDGDKFEISYDQNLDNDIAILAMAQYVNSILEGHFRKMKSSAKGKQLTAINGMIEKANKSRIGLTAMLSYTMASKESWDAARADAKAKSEVLSDTDPEQ